MSKNNFPHALKEACKEKEIDIDIHFIPSREIENKLFLFYRSNRNIATWGIKRKQEHYTYNDKNVLFFEFCVLRQKFGWWIDSVGLYKDSRFNKERLWERRHTKEEYIELCEYMKKWFNRELFSHKCKSGPILIALQHEIDAPVKFYFKHGQKENFVLEKTLKIFAEYLPDVPAIVRPHPKYLDKWNINEERYLKAFRKDWVLNKDGNIYDILQDCNALVTVNSTLAIEAVALGIPVATIGSGVFNDSGILLECEDNLEKLREIYSYRANVLKTIDFFCALLRHQIPCSPTVEDFLKNDDFNMWTDKSKRKRSNESIS